MCFNIKISSNLLKSKKCPFLAIFGVPLVKNFKKALKAPGCRDFSSAKARGRGLRSSRAPDIDFNSSPHTSVPPQLKLAPFRELGAAGILHLAVKVHHLCSHPGLLWNIRVWGWKPTRASLVEPDNISMASPWQKKQNLKIVRPRWSNLVIMAQTLLTVRDKS